MCRAPIYFLEEACLGVLQHFLNQELESRAESGAVVTCRAAKMEAYNFGFESVRVTFASPNRVVNSFISFTVGKRLPSSKRTSTVHPTHFSCSTKGRTSKFGRAHY